MFEHFTPEARAVLESTPACSVGLGHNYIGTEHILLALVGAEQAGAPGHLVARGVTVDNAAELIRGIIGSMPNEADALRAVGVDPHALRDASERLGVNVRIGGLTPVDPDRVPLTGRANRILEMASAAGGEAVMCDHILAAMLDEDSGLAVIVLEKLGVSLEDLRAELGT
jgi:ATP-dependent Clp protease ATP-binding subunit ClpA